MDYVVSNKVNVRRSEGRRDRLLPRLAHARARPARCDQSFARIGRKIAGGGSVAVRVSVVDLMKKAAAALAVAGGGRERAALSRLLRAFRSGVALLDRAHAAPRRGLVFRRGGETPLAA